MIVLHQWTGAELSSTREAFSLKIGTEEKCSLEQQGLVTAKTLAATPRFT
jgi:hypothetical protein